MVMLFMVTNARSNFIVPYYSQHSYRLGNSPIKKTARSSGTGKISQINVSKGDQQNLSIYGENQRQVADVKFISRCKHQLTTTQSMAAVDLPSPSQITTFFSASVSPHQLNTKTLTNIIILNFCNKYTYQHTTYGPKESQKKPNKTNKTTTHEDTNSLVT